MNDAESFFRDSEPDSMPSLPTMRGGGLGLPGDQILGRIDQYDLVKSLGGGGFGVVYLARDTVSGVDVALKTLHPLLKHNAEEMDSLREKFALVARLTHQGIAKALVLHPCKSVDVWDDETRRALRLSAGDSVMVMDFAPGVTLSRWRRQFPGGVVPPQQALDIARQVAAALDYAHAAKIVHRDVKPGNVMVETVGGASRLGGASRPGEPLLPSGSAGRLAPPSLRVRLLDFGLAAEIRSSMSRVSTEQGDTSGTRPYMAPEQWQGGAQDGRTDQYALACVVYELLSGATPFAGVFETGDSLVMAAAVEKRTPEPVPGLSRAANAALLRALAKDRTRRYPSCSAFVEALSSAMAPRSFVRRVAGSLAAVAALAAVAVGAGLYFTQIRRDAEPPPPRPAASDVAPVARPVAAPVAPVAPAPAPVAAPVASVAPAPATALPPEGAPVAELQAARARAFGALEDRRAAYEPDDSPESAALLAEIDALETRISAALEADEAAARDAEARKRRARADAAMVTSLKAAARQQADAVSRYRKWNDGEFKKHFDALDAAKASLDALSDATDLPAAKDLSAEIAAAAAWIAENSVARAEIDAVESAIEAMKGDLEAAEAATFAKAKLGKAEMARSDAAQLREKGKLPQAKAKYDEAKRLFDDALSSALAARAASKAKEATALAEAAKIRKDWDAVLSGANEALRHEPQNADALALKREAEAQLKAIADAKAEAERKAEAARRAREEAAAKAEAERRAHEEAAAKAEAERKSASALTQSGSRAAGARETVRIGSQTVALRWCPPGSFTMGSPISEDGRFASEQQHRVTLTKGFYMGETEVTQGLWKEVMGSNPSDNKAGNDYPVENVSWNDCQDFLRKLNDKVPHGWHFRLPTEAQWEYACRAGTTGAYAGTGRLDDMGWFASNSGISTHPVAKKNPNAWGLYDMHGNVWEWCADWYGTYPTGAVTDPTGPASGANRVLRGGSCWGAPRNCRSASRDGNVPDYRGRNYGLRLLAFQDGN